METNTTTHSSTTSINQLQPPTLQQCPAGQFTDNHIVAPGHVAAITDTIQSNIDTAEAQRHDTSMFKCRYCIFNQKLAQFNADILQCREDNRLGPHDSQSKEIRRFLQLSLEQDEKKLHHSYNGPTTCTYLNPIGNNTTTLHAAATPNAPLTPPPEPTTHDAPQNTNHDSLSHPQQPDDSDDRPK